MISSTRTALAVALAVALGSATAPARQKRPITEHDLFKFTWIADPQIAPDGGTVAFVQVVVNEKDNKYESAIYVVPAAGGSPPARLTSGTRDASPRWAPDGTWLAFVRPDEKDMPQIHVLPMNGGEARPLTALPRGASAPVWSPDGRTIAFSSTTTADDLKKPDPAAKPERKSDVKVVSSAVYRANGNPAYTDPDRRSHIWTVAFSAAGEKPSPKQITTGAFDERGPQWSPDGAHIYFVSDRVAESYYNLPDSDLYRVPAAGGDIARVASIDGGIGTFALSPDGKRVAFVGSFRGEPVRSYSQPDLWIADVGGSGAPKNLTAAYDFDVNGGIGGDQAAPRGEQPKPIVWSRDGGTVIVTAGEHGSSNLQRVTVATGRIEPVTAGAHDVVAYTASRDGASIAATISTQTNIGDLAIVKNGAAPQQPALITHVNETLFSSIAQSEPEEIWYSSFDGRRIQGWILKPPDFDPSRKYPLILQIHGGPHSAYGNVYTHEFQWMAAKGYVVLFTNPRGSTTYGQEFGNLIQHRYPGDDYKDLMAGVDEVLKRGYVDANRLGVTGGSGGGLLTNWTITQTPRFRAAVSQRDIADWYGFWFTADFTLFQPTWFRKAPWEDPDDFHARSPITHVGKVTTPLMLILGDLDYRTPPGEGGEQMFRALKYRRIPTVMVRFPRETHELSRSGEPWHRIERLQHIVGWMDKWLQGKTTTTYEQ
ncbi:MAG TPA: S9 family peptidase [Vicinamibacterales bacterium]|nr:S9 family peptidase [Vicinamibacterales bacterium]